jgi:hypothetical protein
MAYTILNTDGTTLLLLADGQVDKSATSLSLIGRNYASYGQDLNNNFVKLLANSANTSGNPPRSPLTGQLWYDTTVRRLKVYDNGFKTIGAVSVATSQPNTLQTGDLWFDSTRQQLKIYSSGVLYNVGPIFPASVGSAGWDLPLTTITDQDSEARDVILLRSYGTTIGLAYYNSEGTNEPFSMDLTDLSTYVPNATTSTVVSGLTLIGDLSVSGQVTNNYLSMAIDLDALAVGVNRDALGFRGVTTSTFGTGATDIQNPAIEQLLNKMFPPVATTATTSTTVMSGIPVGTQARVICKYSFIGGQTISGYQVRVFRTAGTYTNASWEAYYFSEVPLGASTNTRINYIG